MKHTHHSQGQYHLKNKCLKFLCVLLQLKLSFKAVIANKCKSFPDFLFREQCKRGCGAGSELESSK